MQEDALRASGCAIFGALAISLGLATLACTPRGSDRDTGWLGATSSGNAAGPEPTAPVTPPPFTSVPSLPSHRSNPWVLKVESNGDTRLPCADPSGPNACTYRVAEERAGDVPMPPGLAWRCRFDHVRVDGNMVGTWNASRELRCSDSGWRSFDARTSGYVLNKAGFSGGESEDHPSFVLHDGVVSYFVMLRSCPAGDRSLWYCKPASELP
jgi:hypothetical protein